MSDLVYCEKNWKKRVNSQGGTGEGVLHALRQ